MLSELSLCYLDQLELVDLLGHHRNHSKPEVRHGKVTASLRWEAFMTFYRLRNESNQESTAKLIMKILVSCCTKYYFLPEHTKSYLWRHITTERHYTNQICLLLAVIQSWFFLALHTDADALPCIQHNFWKKNSLQSLSILLLNNVGNLWLHWCLRLARCSHIISFAPDHICISSSSLSAYTALLIAGFHYQVCN